MDTSRDDSPPYPKPVCVECHLGNHAGCLWAVRPNQCSCACPSLTEWWLSTDDLGV